MTKTIQEIAQEARERIKDEAFHKTETGHSLDLTQTRQIIIDALTSYTEELKKVIEGKKYTTLGTSKEYFKTENTPNGLAQHYTDEFTAKWHNGILDDIISELNHQ